MTNYNDNLVGEDPNQLPDRHRINLVDTYQKLTRQTAIYPDAMKADMALEDGSLHVSAFALSYVALGLGEQGEVQGKIKKLIRDGSLGDDGYVTISDEKRKEILKEVGDLCWYVARLCDELHADMSEVLAGNLVKLLSRKDRGVLGGSGDNR